MTTDTTTTPTGDTLADWAGWWIEAGCRCRLSYLPCRHLAREHGGARRVVDVAARLRCSRCGDRPAVVLVDDMRGAGETGSRVYGRARRVPVPDADGAGPSIRVQP